MFEGKTILQEYISCIDTNLKFQIRLSSFVLDATIPIQIQYPYLKYIASTKDFTMKIQGPLLAICHFSNTGLHSDFENDYWAALAEKGYQEAAKSQRKLLPVNHCDISTSFSLELTIVRQIFLDRVIKENNFGSICSLRTLLYRK